MVAEALASLGRVQRVDSAWGLARMLGGRELWSGQMAILIYTSLLAPLAAALRFLIPGIVICYMVRGDEISYARHGGRPVRAWIALAFQRMLAACGCRFVFASEDLCEVFRGRLGPLGGSSVLPNTLGRVLGPTRAFDGEVAVVGEFGSVKNIEPVLEALSDGSFRVHVFGNSTVPRRWIRPWLKSHGRVTDLSEQLRSCSVVVLNSVSEGFPNVLVEALEAGCAVVVRRGFPFEHLPVDANWRFDPSCTDLKGLLQRLAMQRRDFIADNGPLVRLIESDWQGRVGDVFAPLQRRAS